MTRLATLLTNLAFECSVDVELNGLWTIVLDKMLSRLVVEGNKKRGNYSKVRLELGLTMGFFW